MLISASAFILASPVGGLRLPLSSTVLYTSAHISFRLDPARYSRVLTQTVSPDTYDATPISYTTTYTYSHPAYNWSAISAGEDYVNSARVWYSTNYPPVNPIGYTHLATPMTTEFRGHAVVTETNSLGNKTVHNFNQGYYTIAGQNTPCTPVLVTDSCFLGLRDNEFLVGKEYHTLTLNAAGTLPLSEITHTYTVSFTSYTTDTSQDALSGLWRAYNYESSALQTSYGYSNDNSTGSWVGKTQETDYTNDTTYGNQTQMIEKDASGIVLRKTTHNYATPVDIVNHYIVNHPRADIVYDVSGTRQAATFYQYDNDSTYGNIDNRGNLTMVFKVYDNNLVFSAGGGNSPASGTLLGSSAMGYGYDGYGNVITSTTYTSPAFVQYNSNWYLTAPPISSGRAVTTYDGAFHLFSTNTVEPGATMAYTATYDTHMGTLISVQDPNQQTATATYDGFGRMISVTKPLDSQPTNQAYYYDWELPFRYKQSQRDTSADQYRETQSFYNGMGEQIQTKQESKDGQQNIIEDKLYDGTGQATADSQPRYYSETISGTFYHYVPITNTALENFTYTGYDPLGRPTVITAADGTLTNMNFWMPSAGIGSATTTIDANLHKTQDLYDVFGRLAQVIQFTGTNSGNWASYNTASYAYNNLDLLTSTTTVSSTTTMSYDKLGRKTSMSDPDMGSYSYGYDAVGRVMTQTDALNNSIYFQYDMLDRLTQKTYSTGAPQANYYYDASGSGNYGIGQRTSMSRGLPATPASSTTWKYDNRGRVSSAVYKNSGLGTAPYEYDYTYDSADRITTMTLPGDQITNQYDDAWRQTQLYSNNFSTAYAQNAKYNALSQPLSGQLGNGLTENWSYTSPISRVAQHTVTSTLSTLLNYQYQYDPAGNVSTITNSVTSEIAYYGYDALNRLNAWSIPNSSISESYAYDPLGNLTSKAGVTYTYGMSSNPTCLGIHQVCTAGSTSYTYNADGNMTGTYAWNSDNQLTSVGSLHNYTYDAEGERASLADLPGQADNPTVTTYYLGGSYEYQVSSNGTTTNTTATIQYAFGGRVVAQRTLVNGDPTGTLIYLHGDHLGSVSLATNTSGAQVSQQLFDPWGKVRSGGISQTDINYTGQRKDSATGLLYYNSRYYNPAIARFLSADTIVPGSNSVKGLTVDYHETGFASAMAGENALTLQKGFYFQLSSSDRQNAKSPNGPGNPQALNRYSYAGNNPMSNLDPTGHTYYLTGDEAALFYDTLKMYKEYLTDPINKNGSWA